MSADLLIRRLPEGLIIDNKKLARLYGFCKSSIANQQFTWWPSEQISEDVWSGSCWDFHQFHGADSAIDPEKDIWTGRNIRLVTSHKNNRVGHDWNLDLLACVGNKNNKVVVV